MSDRCALLIGVAALVLAAGCAPASAATAAAATGASPSRTAPTSRIAGGFGVLPPAGAPARKLDRTILVVYHGGPVMHDVTLHTLFWAPPGHHFSGPPSAATLGYEALVQRFLGDVAADSGGSGNVFSVLPEYSDRRAPGAYAIRYDPALDSVDATDPYPVRTAGCVSPAGALTCVTDAQVRAEVSRVVAARAPHARGLSHLWLVLLPPDVDECLQRAVCASNEFGGYHSLSSSAAGLNVYAVVPDPAIELTPPPGSDPQGNPEAEVAIDTLAHEAVEAITDPTGTGWMDPNGFEVGDRCEGGPQYGEPLGFAPDGSPYNQVIAGHEYLIQAMWSNAASGCVERRAGRGAVPLLPEVSLSQFSPMIGGRTQIPKAGIAVRVLLLRGHQPAAIASATTRADGSWRATLFSPFDFGLRAPGDDRDVVVILYGRGGPPPETILTGNGGDPFSASGWTGWYALDHGYRVTRHGTEDEVRVAPCAQTGEIRVRIGEGPSVPATEACATDTDEAVVRAHGRSLARAVVRIASTDNRAVSIDNRAGALIRLAIVAGEPDSVSALRNPLIPFAPSGLPSCTADLQYGTVTCGGLVPGAQYAALRARGHAVRLARASASGLIHTRRFPGARPLAAGDAVALHRVAAAARGVGVAAGKAVTVLHVGLLRVAIDGRQTVVRAGACAPGLYLGPGLSSPPVSSAVVARGVAGTGKVCPPDGSMRGASSADIEETDDLSGGQTRTEVPLIEDTAPLQDETVHGVFRLLAGAGLPGPDRSVIPSRARVAVSIAPAGGGRPVFRAANVNTATGVAAGPFPPGVYRARWVLHDLNGDTRTMRSRFIVGAG